MRTNPFTFPVFRPRPLDPCFCQSGELFGWCCGSEEPDRGPPHGVHIVRQFLDPELCRRWVEQLEGAVGTRSGVYDHGRSSGAQVARKVGAGRTSEYVDTGALQVEIEAQVRRAFSESARVYKRVIPWFERPRVLRYEPGQHYGVHADNCHREPHENFWTKKADRDVSLLIYLNEAFTGGSLEFEKFHYHYQPRIGDLLYFPSDNRYKHAANPVESGIRYVVVSWAPFADEPKIYREPPAVVVSMSPAREVKKAMPVGFKVPDFNPQPESPCICRSGRLFKDCCGSTAPNRPPPPGVMAMPGFIDRKTCKRWVKYLEKQPRASAQVLDMEKSTPEKPVFVEDKARVCHEVKGGKIQAEINEAVKQAYLRVAAATRRTMEWMEMPHVLRYEPGGYYVSHADSCQRDEATKTWYKVNDRDLSLLMYINDDFTGGGLTFTRFNCRFTPNIGDVLVFPSDHRYEHCAHVVDSGFRYAIVSWGAIKGVQRVLPKPPDHAIML